MVFVKYPVANNARWQLNTPIGSNTLSVILQSNQGDMFPDHNGTTDTDYPCTLVSFDVDLITVLKREIVLVTAKSWDTFTITRWWGTCIGADGETTQGNTQYAFDENDYFFIGVVAEVIEDIQDELSRLEDEKLNISDYQNWTKTYGATSTWNDSYAVTLSPAPASYQTWMTFRFLADVANTWAATLNVNSLGAKTIKKMHDQDLATWDIEAGQIVVVTYDGTNFQMDSQVATIPTVSITSETEDVTGDIDADYLLEYDTSAWANRKVKPSVWKATNAEAKAWTATNKFVTPDNLGDNTVKPVAWAALTAASAAWPYQWVQTTYTKRSEWTIAVNGIYTVAFDLKSYLGWATAYCRIYKNWSPFGTERTTTSSTDANFTENLEFEKGDTIEFRCKTTNVTYEYDLNDISIKFSLATFTLS